MSAADGAGSVKAEPEGERQEAASLITVDTSSSESGDAVQPAVSSRMANPLQALRAEYVLVQLVKYSYYSWC